MDVVKTILMGCGALALLSVVGCVGISTVGYYALDQAIEEQQAMQANEWQSPSERRTNGAETTQSSDPFGEYEANTFDGTDGAVDDWGDESK